MRSVLLLILLLLPGCEATPETLMAATVAGGVGSIAIIQRSPLDAVYSLVTGRDCSIVRLDRGQTYCRPLEPEPPAQPFCTRSLGVVDCWQDPAMLPGHPTGVAAGPDTLTPEQEANRTRRWP
jgi:hypothetical protein